MECAPTWGYYLTTYADETSSVKKRVVLGAMATGFDPEGACSECNSPRLVLGATCPADRVSARHGQMASISSTLAANGKQIDAGIFAADVQS